MGGGCSDCGYNENLAALHFHHLDSASKLFKLDHRMLSNRKWDSISKEAEKCILLCANCHATTHNPEMTLKNVQSIIHGASHWKQWD